MLSDKRILLIIGGGIAAYKSLYLIRLLKAGGAAVTPVLTPAGANFVTPLSVSALAGEKVHDALFDLTDEAEMGHIELSRSADLIVVAPATADLIARMASGRADDLAATLLLATDTPVLLAPAMNVRMWQHPATHRNLATLRADGIRFVGPDEGAMACGEFGPGRMAEPDAILAAIAELFTDGPLAGRHVIVTSGPTHEPIDPVRYIANRSSGAQGTALAAALRDLGARVTFVTGPAAVPPPAGVTVVAVETAVQMLAAVQAALPAEAAVFAAAVADWRVANAAGSKMKKDGSGQAPALQFVENPDILAAIARGPHRPRLVVGFAAETDDVLAHASAKRLRKGCDWIVANDVSAHTGIMSGVENAVTVIDAQGAETWPRLAKTDVARRLALRMAKALKDE
jgi:phosphopantothenoylcysteine decarboxylase/phosphopantothenate--cysteine ligase